MLTSNIFGLHCCNINVNILLVPFFFRQSTTAHSSHNDECLSYLKRVSSKYDFHYCYHLPDIVWLTSCRSDKCIAVTLISWFQPEISTVLSHCLCWCLYSWQEVFGVRRQLLMPFCGDIDCYLNIFLYQWKHPSVDFLHQRLSEDYSFFFQFLSFFNVARVSCKRHRLPLRLTACRNASKQREQVEHVVNNSLVFLFFLQQPTNLTLLPLRGDCDLSYQSLN